MTTDNLALWEKVWQTDPSHTKRSKLDGREVTSINPTYLVRKATEQWGPIGIGWGYEIVEERFDDGGPMTTKDGQPLGANMVMHTLRLKLWFVQDGQRGEVEHYGHTPYVYRTQYGAKTDMEAPKKSLTDALKKCLSMLGYSADVFLGLYDLPDYVQEQQVREQIERADDADDAAAQARQEFQEWIAEQMRGYGMVPSAGALRAMHNATLNKAKRRAATLQINPEQVGQRLEERYQERRKELSPDIELACQECGTIGRGKEGSKCHECGGKTAPAGTGANDHSNCEG